MQLSPFRHMISDATIPLASFQKRAQHIGARSIRRRTDWCGRQRKSFIKTMEERMTQNVSRRSLLALGAGQITVVSDGPLPLGPPKGTFIGVPDEEVRKMLSDNFLSPDNVVLEQNSPIVNTGDKLVLFDTGMGTLKLFGPTTGRQQKSMAEAGIKPGDIDAVVLSHAHIDHIGGIVGADDKSLFPNAQFYIAQSDFDFWTDESKVGGPLKDFVLHARKNLLPVRDRLVFFKDGQEFLPGVQAIAAPGHTVGHT